MLLPIINKFIAAIEDGEVDKDFWKACYSVVPAVVQKAKSQVFGWVCNFFPYNGDNHSERF
jgi:hypothetical protein